MTKGWRRAAAFPGRRWGAESLHRVLGFPPPLTLGSFLGAKTLGPPLQTLSFHGSYNHWTSLPHSPRTGPALSVACKGLAQILGLKHVEMKVHDPYPILKQSGKS